MPPSRSDDPFRRGLRLLWRYVRTHPGPFSVSVLGAATFGVMAVAFTVVVGRTIDDVFIPAFRGETDVPVRSAAVALLAISVVRGLGVVTRRYFGQMTVGRMMVTWRDQLFDRYVDLPLEFHRRRPTGELMAHADTDVQVATMAMMPLPFSVGVVVLIAVALLSLVVVDPLLMGVALLLFPALAVMNRIYTRRVEGPAGRAQARIGDASAIAHESIDGALVVKTLGREHDEVERLAAAADALRTERLIVGRLRANFEPTLEALPNLGIVALLAIGSWRVSTGAITTGDLVQAMALFALLSFPFRVVGFLLEELPRSVVAADRIDDVLAERLPAEPATRVDVPTGALDLAFRNVSFHYDGDPVLGDLSFRVAPGETAALVGSTGSGKSTVCQLAARLYDPERGAVLVGGVDLRHADPRQVQAGLALVFQESFLFAASVRENLALDADVSDADVWAALGLARAHDFVARLPDGLDTVVGERGVTLSGGQRQRMALARAVIRRPRLLLLDDATSAVDPVIEAQILEGLAGETTTTLIVAQRLSTITSADRVLYLADRRIVAAGAHDDLLAHPGYEALVRAYEEQAV